MAEDLVIEVKDLKKYFPVTAGLIRQRKVAEVRAVDGISFEIEPGELVGYIGPNGAGKSTTIKMLTGLLVPTGGELWVNGRVPWRERRAHVAAIGAVFGQRASLWWDLPAIESLELLQHDNYLVRDTSTGERRYRFRYGIMRRWWQINKG